jgi:hypothetical protein
MKAQGILLIVFAIVLPFACAFKVASQPVNSKNDKPNFRDHSHDNQPLPDGILAWHTLSQTTVVMEGERFAHFTFSFTNISSSNVTILNLDPTCGCTTADLPSAPWKIPAGFSGEIKANVDLTNKTGILTEYIKVITDEGSKNLTLRIDIQPKPAS